MYIHISESMAKVCLSIKPRHPGHSVANLSETLQHSSKAAELAVGERGVFTTPLRQKCMALQRLRSQTTNCQDASSQQQLWAGLEVGCEEAQSTCAALSQGLP